MGGCCGFGAGHLGTWGGAGLVGLVLNLIFISGMLFVLGGGAYWLLRGLRLGARGTPASGTGEGPLEIAARRLAAGEISVAEFEEIRERIPG